MQNIKLNSIQRLFFKIQNFVSTATSDSSEDEDAEKERVKDEKIELRRKIVKGIRYMRSGHQRIVRVR